MIPVDLRVGTESQVTPIPRKRLTMPDTFPLPLHVLLQATVRSF